LHIQEDEEPEVSTVSENYIGYETFLRLAGPSTPGGVKEEQVDCNLTTLHPAIIDEMAAWFIEHCERRQHDGTVYMMAMTKDGPKFQPIGKGGADMIPENYTPGVRDAFKRISKELVDEVPRGRLSVISGPPGTGKTYLIRGLLRNVKRAVFVVVPQQALAALLDPSGMAALVEFRAEMDEDPIVLILEDADDALAPRREGDTSTISSLLNLGDGIIGSAIDVRVVATTNRDHQEFDTAILRPGRLSTHVVVGDLDSETASAVFKRLTDKDEVLPACSLATVYQKAYDAGWQGGDKSTASKRKMGFGG
jgi:ATP-dependent 26S proteasome regulatory subunit